MAGTDKGRGDQPADVERPARRHRHATPADETGDGRSAAGHPAVQRTSRIRAREIDVSGAHIVQINGNFVGAAMRDPAGFRFVALDVRLDDLDGRVWSSFFELRQQIESVVRLGRWGDLASATPG